MVSNNKKKEINGNVNSSMNPIQSEGDLFINGDVENGALIIAKGDIHINGNIYNSKIKSLEGNIIIKGGIHGVQSQIYAEKDVIASYVNNAKIKANGNVIINNMSIDSNIVGKRSIYIHKNEGVVQGGTLEAGDDIIVNSAGNEYKSKTVLKLENFRHNELYSKLIDLYKDEVILSQELHTLDKFIQVIKILGKKVINLPLEKKNELALKVKRYNEIKSKLNEIDLTRKKIYEEMEDNNELKRVIIVRDYIYEGVLVEIDGVQLLINKKYKRVILYKKGIIIISNYDEFMQKRKYLE